MHSIPIISHARFPGPGPIVRLPVRKPPPPPPPTPWWQFWRPEPSASHQAFREATRRDTSPDGEVSIIVSAKYLCGVIVEGRADPEAPWQTLLKTSQPSSAWIPAFSEIRATVTRADPNDAIQVLLVLPGPEDFTDLSTINAKGD